MKKIAGMILLLVVLCIAIDYFSGHRFINPVNVENLTRQIALLSIFAIGEGIVILSGGIDLSVGSVIAFTGLLVSLLISVHGVSPALASLVVFGMCIIIGLAHGALVTKLKLQPFIVTLCTMLIFRGLARRLTEDATMGFGNRFLSFRALGDGAASIPGTELNIPIPVIVLAVVAIIAHFFMRYTVYGRYLYAIGRNPDAARYSGVKVDRMQTASYLVCAVLAGLAGILYATYTNSVQPATTGQAYELYAIAAAVLGGDHDADHRQGPAAVFPRVPQLPGAGQQGVAFLAVGVAPAHRPPALVGQEAGKTAVPDQAGRPFPVLRPAARFPLPFRDVVEQAVAARPVRVIREGHPVEKMQIVFQPPYLQGEHFDAHRRSHQAALALRGPRAWDSSTCQAVKPMRRISQKASRR